MGTPGSPPTRVSAVPDKWVRPIRRLADLSVGPTDLIYGPDDLWKTWRASQDIRWRCGGAHQSEDYGIISVID